MEDYEGAVGGLGDVELDGGEGGGAVEEGRERVLWVGSFGAAVAVEEGWKT